MPRLIMASASFSRECGDDGEAIKAYNDALAIDPNYPEVLNNLGVIFKEQRRVGESGKLFCPCDRRQT